MSKRVLVVDDDRAIRDLMVEAIREEGHEVVCAGSVREAQDTPGPFDMLVVDLGLPNGDGWDVVRHFFPVPSLTVSGGPGCDLQKPFRSRALGRMVSTLLAEHAR